MVMVQSLAAAMASLLVSSALCAEPLIDNERVTVWETTGPGAPAVHDFVGVPLARPGTATWGQRGEAPGVAGSKSIVIELKDVSVAPITNASGYPDAFPRPRIEKLFENDRVIVWSYRWNPGEPTPMHFHDKDTVVVYEDDTTMRSTTPEGKSVVSHYRSGEVHYNARNRVHTETLLSPAGSAVITELK